MSKSENGRSFTVHFDQRDTTPDRLEEISELSGITPEELILRYIAQGLGSHGLSEVPEAQRASMTNIDEFLVAAGAKKPKD